MFCKNCGKEVDEKAYVCIHCGCKIESEEEKTENNVFESLSQAFSVIALVGILVYIIFSDAKNALPVLKLTSFGGAGAAFIGAVFGKIENDDDSNFFHNIVEFLICIALIFKTLINFSE